MKYEDIKKIIESCHLNFLIGSGVSNPFLGTLGEIENLLTDLSKENDSDEKTIIDASIKKHYFDVAIKGNLEILKGDSEKLNITKKNYEDFLDSISKILSKRKTNLVTKQVNLFTTNMDLFLEYGLEKLGLIYNDGFLGRLNTVFGTENFHNIVKKTSTHYEYQSEIPLFNLFKLHGSVNWKIKDNNNIKDINNKQITYDYNLDILNEIEKINSKDSDFLKIEYKNKDCDWKTYSIEELKENLRENNINKKVIHESFIKAYNKLLMINPTKEKFEATTRVLTFYELLRMYSNHLEKENSVLFVFGFSFADEHIREITKRVAKSNPTLIIIIFAYNKTSGKDIEKKIGSIKNIKVIYDEKEKEEDEKKYSLDMINKEFFNKLAKEL